MFAAIIYLKRYWNIDVPEIVEIVANQNYSTSLREIQNLEMYVRALRITATRDQIERGANPRGDDARILVGRRQIQDVYDDVQSFDDEWQEEFEIVTSRHMSETAYSRLSRGRRIRNSESFLPEGGDANVPIAQIRNNSMQYVLRNQIERQ